MGGQTLVLTGLLWWWWGGGHWGEAQASFKIIAEGLAPAGPPAPTPMSLYQICVRIKEIWI